MYDSIGFNAIADEELRHLVTGRICQPMSKKATVDYLRRHFKDDVSLQKIYRYMDKLQDSQKERVQKISVRHTRRLFGGDIGILFYDVTTLYFETTDKDALRNNGFSKDGKNANPQVVLGLLVSRDGYPLSYALFNGAQFEGYTMIPIVDDFVQRYGLGNDFVVIADAGLMSEKNVRMLRSAGHKYIIGARIKKESGAMRDLILSTPHEPGTFKDIPYGDGDRLIVGYSEERARKNEHDREEGVERLRKRYASGMLTKADINRRGYNKFLSISSGVSVCIDESKIEEDKAWDGLKGYRTNTDLPADQVYEHYRQLWHVEKAFRITKGRLEVRPMFHFTEKRIEAHVCICFVALKVYKELERLLRLSGCPYSVDNVLRIAEVIVTLEVDLPKNQERRYDVHSQHFLFLLVCLEVIICEQADFGGENNHWEHQPQINQALAILRKEFLNEQTAGVIGQHNDKQKWGNHITDTSINLRKLVRFRTFQLREQHYADSRDKREEQVGQAECK